MGTRHVIEAKIDGKTKIAQYGQFDGYPTGQGKNIAQFLRSGYDKKIMAESLRNCRWAVDADQAVCDAANAFPKEEWKRFLPQFSRDIGAFVLWLVYGTRRRGLVLQEYQKAPGDIWIEYQWLIDFDTETVSMNGETPVPFAEFTEEWCVNREKQDQNR